MDGDEVLQGRTLEGPPAVRVGGGERAGSPGDLQDRPAPVGPRADGELELGPGAGRLVQVQARRELTGTFLRFLTSHTAVSTSSATIAQYTGVMKAITPSWNGLVTFSGEPIAGATAGRVYPMPSRKIARKTMAA
jgi:hypothetical protein